MNMIYSLDNQLSKAQVVDMARQLHNDEDGIGRIFATMKQTDDSRSAYNAAWVLTHLSRADKRLYLLPRYDELVVMAVSKTLGFRRGLVLTILADLPTCNEPNMDLLDYCLNHLSDRTEKESTRSVMIKLAAEMCKPYPELCREMKLYLDAMIGDIPPCIAAAKKNALKMISQKTND